MPIGKKLDYIQGQVHLNSRNLLQYCLQTAFKRCERKWVQTDIHFCTTQSKGGKQIYQTVLPSWVKALIPKNKTGSGVWRPGFWCALVRDGCKTESKSLGLGNQGLLASYTLPRVQIYPSREILKSKITSIHFYYWYYIEGKVWWVGMLTTPCCAKCGPWP